MSPITTHTTERGAAGRLIPFPTRFEPWVTKGQLAAHLGFSTRWIEMRILEGMPHETFGRSKRFRVSDVESWLTSGEAVA